MRFWHRQDPRVIPELMELLVESKVTGNKRGASYVEDMLLYADIGKDRRKLGMDFVEQTRQYVDSKESL